MESRPPELLHVHLYPFFPLVSVGDCTHWACHHAVSPFKAFLHMHARVHSAAVRMTACADLESGA